MYALGEFKKNPFHMFVVSLFQVLCESISAKSRQNYLSCMESLNEMTVEMLKASSAEDLCKSQKICPASYRKGSSFIYLKFHHLLLREFSKNDEQI